MARSKLRKSNSALSRGQMVRIENRFTLRLEEDTYDPDENGACCTDNGDGEKCVCANTTARECCEQKGEFFGGISCDTDTCPCDVTGACCVPCSNDEAVKGVCISGVTAGACTAQGGVFYEGVDCGTNTCPLCPDNTVYEVKVACCEPCPPGTNQNTERNGNCVVYTGTGFSQTEAEENALSQCSGEVGNVTNGPEGGAPDPCATDNGNCLRCNAKTRPYCLFCTDVDDTECGTTRSGQCVDVELVDGDTIEGAPGPGVIGYNPSGDNSDISCSDLNKNQLCSGSLDDCETCQEVCCCQDGVVGPVPIGTCTGETIELQPGQGCNSTDVDCLFNNFCIVCDGSVCDENTAVYTTDPVSGACIVTVEPEYSCKLINTNDDCGGIDGVDAPTDALDETGSFDCEKYGGGFDPSAGGNGGLCGCADCSLAAIAAAAQNPTTGQCPPNPFICNSCDDCFTTVQMSGEFAGCYDPYFCCSDSPPPLPGQVDPFARCEDP